MITTFTAHLSALLHVVGARTARDERGQTTAEYVGIVAFVAIIVVALFALSDPLSAHVTDIIDAAFDKIADAI